MDALAYGQRAAGRPADDVIRLRRNTHTNTVLLAHARTGLAVGSDR